MVYIFDASFSAALILPDEKTEELIKAGASVGEKDELFVPHLWWYEMANIFRNNILRKRYSYAEAEELLRNISLFKIITDFSSGGAYSEKLLRIAHDYSLSAYDAAYLELALRKQAILGTLDDNLQNAAEKSGVKLLFSRREKVRRKRD
ncbi:MAG: type II toxin-antitoxin system VapC family toxin [Treponema sp.]|jgi:predicted nucleic acid-binding protein|nr:type II toxin-antitoxin system VapC family toxin [Treponema sp.]